LRPIVLTIGGSDPSGGAGVQADLKAIEANGGYATTAITSLTIQNTRGVRRTVAVDAEVLRDQVHAVLTDLDVAALKSGMLGTAANVAVVADLLREARPRPYVLDPVVTSTGGFPLLDDEAIDALKQRLIPRATLLTPNVQDVLALTGWTVRDLSGAEEAGRRLLDLGCAAVLVKGGHLSEASASDVLVTAHGSHTFSADWVDSPHTHGTGCVFASAIATRLARGQGLREAVEDAKYFVTEAIRHGLPLGGGTGPVDPLFALHAGEPGGGEKAGEP
jgi:hydroxymethylpyrimidine/phosphomethylpyrimidine kinase